MSHFNYDLENNSLEVAFENKDENSEKELIDCPEIDKIKYVKSDGKFCGIKFNDFYSDKHIKGIRAEEAFKKYLESRNMPFLYVGQSPVGVERSEFILKGNDGKNGIDGKRPDFLINLQGYGNIFVDVKFRTKLKLGNKKYFYIGSEELEKLNHDEEYFFIPVWLAFTSDDSKKFFFCRNKELYLFYKSIQEEKKETTDDVKLFIRIPDGFFIKDFLCPTQQESLEKEKEQVIKDTIELEKDIKAKILKSIETEKILKTDLLKNLEIEFRGIAYKKELERVFDKMIEDKIIDYKQGKPLKITNGD